MKPLKITLGARQASHFEIGYVTYIRVYKSNGVDIVGKTDEGDTIILEQGLAYDLKPCKSIYVENNEDKEVIIVLFVAKNKVYDSRASFAGSIDIYSLSARIADNYSFDISDDSITRILDGNEVRKSALIYNNSTNIIWIKSKDAIDFDAKAMPLLPNSSIEVNSIEPYFAKVEDDGVATPILVGNLRIYEESY